MLGPGGGIQGPLIVDVIFATGHAVGVFQLGEGPLLAVIGVGIRGVGDAGQCGGDIHRVAIAIDALLLIAKISRHAQAITPVIQPQGKQLGALAFVVDSGIAFALGDVHAHAKLIVVAKALAQIEVFTHAAAAGNIGAEAPGRSVLGALWLQVDATADA